MRILNRFSCLLCQANNTSLKWSTQTKIPNQCLIQTRQSSTKLTKTIVSTHRKDAASVDKGDDKYKPQSPYRERWPINYGWENKLFGGGALPSLDRPLIHQRKERKKDYWDKDHALFGQNDYIDILGDGDVRPVDLMKGPSWIRGFKGNEMQRILRRLEFEGNTLRQLYPTTYHRMQKRLNYLNKHYNYKRSKGIGKGKNWVKK